MFDILCAIGLIGGIGLLVGIFLGLANKFLQVSVDKKEEEIVGVLPGNNCGGCGYPGCSGLAHAITQGQASVNSCPVGGQAVADEIAKIMGVEAEKSEKKVAFVKCTGTLENTSAYYEYYGTMDCRMAMNLPNAGPKSCQNGCLGLGSCIKVCDQNAIYIENGIAKISPEKCVACGKCANICPRKLIELIPANEGEKRKKSKVACASTAPGPATMKVCKTGCIGCGICAKNCPREAITVKDFHASIDQSKCVGCGICMQKCPKKVIIS